MRRLKVPARLAYTVIAGAVACSSSSDNKQPADASADNQVADASDMDASATDAPMEAATTDSCANLYCGPQGGTDAAACPGFICDISQCPTGCEPFV